MPELKTDINSYHAVAPALAQALDVDRSICREMVTHLVANGLLPKSRGRALERPTFEGLARLTIATCAREIGFSKREAGRYAFSADLKEFEKAVAPHSRVVISESIGQVAFAITLPAGIPRSIIDICSKPVSGRGYQEGMSDEEIVALLD